MQASIRACCAAALTFCSRAAAPADWLQFNVDAAHNGNNTAETILSANATGAFAIASLFAQWTTKLPAKADGAPAFLSDVTTPGGTRDLLFLTTNNTGFIASNTTNRLIAVDASNGSIVWTTAAGTGRNWTTSSPAVDPNRQFVYSYLVDGKVHKYAVGDGAEILGGGWPQTATLKPSYEKGSAALTIATSKDGATHLYIANGGYPGDAGDYQGHVTAIDLASGNQRVFNASCSNQVVHFVQAPGIPDCPQTQTAIWARPGVIYDSATDRIYMATGNGTFDPQNFDWGDSVFALHPDGSGDGTGNPLDSYTPVEFQTLQNNDWDLGSTAPAILPSTLAGHPHLAVQGGKDAQLRLLDLDNLSGFGSAGHTGGELQRLAVPQGGQVLPQPAVRVDSAGTTWVFVTTSSGISGLRLGLDAAQNPILTPVWQHAAGGSSPVVANSVLYYHSGQANSSQLVALDPATGAVLWTSSMLGGLHWESPIVVNGRVYVTDESAALWSFALDGIFSDGFQ